MNDLADIWNDIGNEIGDKEMTAETMAQILEQQIFMQEVYGRNVDGIWESRFPEPYIIIPVVYAKKIAEALKLSKKTRGGQRKTWRKQKVYAILLDKARRRTIELEKQGLSALNAEHEAAQELAENRPDLNLKAETIRRDMQRIPKGKSRK